MKLTDTKKIQLLELLQESIRIGEPHERVVAVGDVGLDRVRITGFHGIVDQVRQAGPAVEVLVAPADAVGPFFRGLGNQIHQLLEALAADVTGFVG